MTNKNKKTYEESVQRLEEIVESLNGGQENLAEALKLYEEGVALIKDCTEQLNNAEQKVKMLRIQPDGEVIATDFGENVNE